MTLRHTYLTRKCLLFLCVLITLSAIHYLLFDDFTSSFSTKSEEGLKITNPDHIAHIRLEANIKTIGNEKMLYPNEDQKIKSRSYLLQPQKQQGPGELGTGVDINRTLLSPEDKLKYDEYYKKHHLNIYASDLISVHRTLNPDIIDPWCKTIKYSDLDSCTVIIAFRNEAWSTLLRTVHSVLDHTPESLIDELILVDDGSTEDYLKYKLDVYISYLSKVRIIRLPTSMGLFVAKQTALDQVKSKHFACLDSHSEVSEGWLQPLLQRLKEKPKMLVIPVIGNIYPNNFFYFIHSPDYFYNPKKGVLSMSFDFYLNQRYSPYKKEYIKSLQRTKPMKIAGHQANAFVLNTAFFRQLGGFDTGMQVWGGDFWDTMFKAVMCGDGIEMLPCSHVGHAYRSSIIWENELREAQKTVSNLYRVAEVWMDEYKDLVFERIGNYTLKTGDVSKVKKFKKENNCKPFKYFLEYVTEIVHLYIPVNLIAKGAITKPDGKTCLGNCNSQRLCLAKCYWKGYWQFWELSSDNEIRQGIFCLVPKKNNQVKIKKCKFNKLVQWDYRKDNLIQNKDTGLCLTADEENKLKLAECTGHSGQIWIWERTIHSKNNSKRLSQ